MKRRRLLVGPGLILALVAAFFVWRGAPERRVTPTIRTPRQRALPERPARAAPEIGFVLEQRAALRLDGRQVRALTALRARYERETAGLRRLLEGAAGTFQGGMEGRGTGGETLSGLQERGAEVSQLSRQLAAARLVAWEEAATHLTPAQREQAEALWHAHLMGGRRRAAPRGD